MSLTTNSLHAMTGRLVAKVAFIAGLTLAFDESLKTLVRLTMANCATHDAVGCDYLNAGGVAGILRVENAGSAMGFVQGSFAWVALAALGLLLIPLCGRSTKGGNIAVALGAGLMAGGALGNFCDRLLYGSVTDFIALGETIVINPADVALLAGMALMTRAIWQARSLSYAKPVVLEAARAD